MILSDASGRVVDIDLRGTISEVVARLEPGAPPPRRGRPKLGVTAREVTLLPRHWDWLAAQPGGASAALRRLVDHARKDGVDADARRQTHETVYRAATTLAGDPITAILTEAPGNHAPIGGLKVTTAEGWFAARPSGTEDVYKIYAESFKGPDHLKQIQTEAQALVDAAIA